MNDATRTNLIRAVLAGWKDDLGWDYWTKGQSVDIPMVGLVRVVDYTEGSDYEDGRPTVIIFEVTKFDASLQRDGVKYYRKSGYAAPEDSYGYTYPVNWSGEFLEVRPVEKVVYEYV